MFFIIGFGEEDHRGFILIMPYHEYILTNMTVAIDLAHVAEVMFVRSLHCNATSSPRLAVLFGRKLRSGE